MSTPPPDQYRPGAPWPDPTVPWPGGTRWLPPADDYRPADATGRSAWGAAPGEPAGLPPALEPAVERVGWLLAGRRQRAVEPAGPGT